MKAIFLNYQKQWWWFVNRCIGKFSIALIHSDFVNTTPYYGIAKWVFRFEILLAWFICSKIMFFKKTQLFSHVFTSSHYIYFHFLFWFREALQSNHHDNHTYPEHPKHTRHTFDTFLPIFHLILITVFWSRVYYFHFIDGEMTGQRDLYIAQGYGAYKY